MFPFLRKYGNLISILLFLTLLISICLFPTSGLIPGILFLLFSLAVATLTIVDRQRQTYLQGEISRTVCVRNIVVDIVGILLAIILASLLGKSVAEIATQQINNDLTKLIAGITVGLLAGIGVGLLVRQIWGRVAKT